MTERKDQSKPERYRARSREELLKVKRVRSLPNEGYNPAVRGNPTLEYKMQKVSEMGFDPKLLEQMPKTVAELNVYDLEDYAKKIQGVEVRNDRVNSLTIEEMQGIEALFADSREQVLSTVAANLAEGAGIGEVSDVDVSCCCCTPCCCCAATETNPFATIGIQAIDGVDRVNALDEKRYGTTTSNRSTPGYRN